MKHRFLFRNILLFILAGLIWTFGIKHLLLEEGLHLMEADHTITSDLLTDHLPDFLFIVFAAWVLYRGINRSYQHLSEANEQLHISHEQIKAHEKAIEVLYDKERYLRSIMSVIHDINGYISTAKDTDELGKKCCSRLLRHSNYRLIWIGMIEKGEIVVQYHSTDLTGYLDFSSLPMPEELRKTNCPICMAIEEDQTIIINDVDDPTLPEKLRAAVKEGIFSLVSLPLKSRGDGQVLGALNIYSASKSGFSVEEVAMLEELAGDIGFAIHAFEEEEKRRRLEEEKLRNYEQTLFSLIDLIESRDTYTAGHTRRVAQYSIMIAGVMGYSEEEIEQLRKAAMLHDIGKIQTPDAILLKPGKLSDYEYELIQEHVSVGYNMLQKIDMYKELAEIMRHHHEHYDGSGYPDGLRSEEIPPLSRIMIVADAFDAMTTSRIYKSRMSVEDAITELQRCAGSQFHPEVVEAAVKTLPNIQLGAAHQLPTSRIDNERLAYFYKDRLTGAFNYDYLPVILKNEDIYGKFHYAYAVFLHGFSKFNNDHGWSYGDWFLGAFGAYLNNTFGEAMIFRRFGDDFLLLSAVPISCNADELERNSPVADTKLGISLLAIDLQAKNVQTIDDIEHILSNTPSSLYR